MKIDGIDPLLLNKIKEKPDLKEVQKTESSATYTRVSRERGSDRGSEPGAKDASYGEKVEKALNRLNDDAERDGLKLRFRAKETAGFWNVEVFDTESDRVVHEIPTERALEVANRIQGLFGLLMDKKS